MNPERLTRIALTTLRLNPKLYQCEPMSFIACLFMSAQLGLEPNVNGEAWIIPYNTKNGLVAQFQVGYLGWIKLFYNHQSSVTIQMETVHKNDTFSFDIGKNELSHKYPGFDQERGEAIGYYAIANLKNGGRTFKVMSKAEAMEFAKKFSKCYSLKEKNFYEGTPWREHFDAMAMKTVLKQLIKQLPKSVEIQQALALDETIKTRLDADMVTIPDQTDYSPEPAQIAPASEARPSGKATVLDIKIHEAKKILGEKDYYRILKDQFKVEHMTALDQSKKEMFFALLNGEIDRQAQK